jgi:putative intracellular protease/amidase
MCAFEVDAWGQHLAGLQNVDGRDIRQNATRREGVLLRNGQRYTLTLEVRKDRVRGLLDGEEIVSLQTTGADLSLPDLWRLPHTTHLAVAAWESAVTFHALDVRSRSGAPLALTRPGARDQAAATPRPQPTPKTPRPSNTTAAGKRVVLVIANQDFFYREYSEPREELERAGIRVVVAAGRKETCRPHDGSGQGSDGGLVMPDIALADVRAADYDAILFSGGWGASMYQFAFRGQYQNPVYNGDAPTKAHVNRVINEFLAADKYVCALCNAVSVLAWARVEGKSPLQGKRVCAPTRAAAAGIYNGRMAQPSCRWHPEANGAILSPAGAIGDPKTNRDDVLVDGRIITGEDDPSAREMGRRIVEVLSFD